MSVIELFILMWKVNHLPLKCCSMLTKPYKGHSFVIKDKSHKFYKHMNLFWHFEIRIYQKHHTLAPEETKTI